MNTNWTEIGAIDDIPLRGARCVNTPAGRVAVFRTAENQVFAIEEPGQRGSLNRCRRGIAERGDGAEGCLIHPEGGERLRNRGLGRWKAGGRPRRGNTAFSGAPAATAAVAAPFRGQRIVRRKVDRLFVVNVFMVGRRNAMRRRLGRGDCYG